MRCGLAGGRRWWSACLGAAQRSLKRPGPCTQVGRSGCARIPLAKAFVPALKDACCCWGAWGPCGPAAIASQVARTRSWGLRLQRRTGASRPAWDVPQPGACVHPACAAGRQWSCAAGPASVLFRGYAKGGRRQSVIALVKYVQIKGISDLYGTHCNLIGAWPCAHTAQSQSRPNLNHSKHQTQAGPAAAPCRSYA